MGTPRACHAEMGYGLEMGCKQMEYIVDIGGRDVVISGQGL